MCFPSNFRLTEMRVYLDKTERLEDYQLLLTEQSDVSPEQQILLFQVRSCSFSSSLSFARLSNAALFQFLGPHYP